jgi:hypothetical protein
MGYMGICALALAPDHWVGDHAGWLKSKALLGFF